MNGCNSFAMAYWVLSCPYPAAQGNSMRKCALACEKARRAAKLAEKTFREAVASVQEAESARKTALALEAERRVSFFSKDEISISAGDREDRPRELHRAPIHKRSACCSRSGEMARREPKRPRCRRVFLDSDSDSDSDSKSESKSEESRLDAFSDLEEGELRL